MADVKTVRKLIENEVACSLNPEVLTRLADIRCHTQGYAEDGFDDSKQGIVVFGDFTEITIGRGDQNVVDYTLVRLSLKLHKVGVETQRITEWTFCHRCHRAVRLVAPTDADGSFWVRSWFLNTVGQLICRCCVEAEPNLYLADAEGRGDKLMTFPLPLASLGYIKVQQHFEFNYESKAGHQPEVLCSSLRQQGLRRFILERMYESETELVYAVWLHVGEFDALRQQQPAQQNLN